MINQNLNILEQILKESEQIHETRTKFIQSYKIVQS
jgi:hypothetical protein